MENLKERIVPITNEGKQFFIYFSGQSSSNDNNLEEEQYRFLDENLNEYISDIEVALYMPKDTSVDLSESFSFLSESGIIIGPRKPAIKDEHGDFVPYENPNAAGMWSVPSKEEKEKYIKLLIEQNTERVKSTLVH